MIYPRLLCSALAAASVVVLFACSSSTTTSDAGTDAGAVCADGVKCALVVTSDNTCTGAKGTCACTAQGVVSCAPGFVISQCDCNTPCSTEGNYCTGCGASFTTCQCMSGKWTVTHGVMCGGFDAGGGG